MEAVILGLLQGLSEFLPISSSGHLTLVQHFLHVGEEGSQVLATNVVLHIATFLVIVIWYRKRLRQILLGGDWSYWKAVIICSIPTGIIGLSIQKQEDIIFTWPWIPALILCMNGLMLIFFNSRFKNQESHQEVRAPNTKQSLWVGLAQGVAALPGLSRSGSTIGMARWQGLSAEAATEFSLLASLPPILGVTLLKAKDISHIQDWQPLLLSAGLAMASGFLAVGLLLKIVRRGSWRVWGIYCLMAGLLSLTLTLIPHGTNP